MPQDLQRVLDAVLDGIIVITAAGLIERINAEACRILECSPESVVGVRAEDLFGPDHAIWVLARRVLASGRPAIQDDAEVERRFDRNLEVDVAVSPLAGLSEEAGDREVVESELVSGVVVALRDRTVRNSLREIVSEREKLTSYGHIAAGIAHEVKNPLSGIRGAAELLELRAPDGRSRETLGLIVREVDRITALVDELMVFAKGEKLRPTRVNVHQVLDGVLHLLSMDPLSANVKTERFYDPSIPELEADADRLTQVFLNLGRNALQAMEETGGTLEVHTGMTLHNRLSNSAGQLVPTVEIAIVDTGPGIEPAVAQRLATPFFTTKAKGTGLGLSVARHWIACHGGNLRVSSELGEGAKMFVTLPLKPMNMPKEAASPRFPLTGEGNES